MYNLTTPDGPDTRDPREIDWRARQARALVSFGLDGDGLPLNPCQPHLAPGRNGLWHWGEACTADAIVTCIGPATGHQMLLMIERGDGHGWALPGGMMDPGETPRETVSRELDEETGLYRPAANWRMLPARYVPDPRAGRHAWMVTTPGITTLMTSRPPAVDGRDDARRAEWLPADSYAQLQSAVADRGSELFASHRGLLAELL